MIRLARGGTEIEGLELDEGRILFDATFSDAPPVGTHTYSAANEDAGPEHALHGLSRRRNGSHAVSAGAKLLCRLHPLRAQHLLSRCVRGEFPFVYFVDCCDHRGYGEVRALAPSGEVVNELRGGDSHLTGDRQLGQSELFDQALGLLNVHDPILSAYRNLSTYLLTCAFYC